MAETNSQAIVGKLQSRYGTYSRGQLQSQRKQFWSFVDYANGNSQYTFFGSALGDTATPNLQKTNMPVQGSFLIMYGINRSASIASHRLCMKTPVQNISIFFKANRAHLKGFHGGFIPVVRQVAYYAETWPAIRAVDKWVGQTVRLRLHIYKAIFAYGNIRTDLGNGIRSIAAFYNTEIIKSF